jgi:GH15 family glucan-1,4-alpha-glucosidase
MASGGSTVHSGGSRRAQLGGYLPIEDYGMVGNMHTCALIGIDGSVDFMCWPDFDSPSVFCRLMDQAKGGHFSIAPPEELGCTIKQQYLPSSCILQTRFIHEDGVVDLVDFFPRPKNAQVMTRGYKQSAYREATNVQEELKKWLVRRVDCIRGSMTLGEFSDESKESG